MQGSARKDVVFGATRVYTVAVPGPKWKSWLKEVAAALQEGVGQLMRQAGLELMQLVMDNEVRHLAGERYERRGPEQPFRWGREKGFLIVRRLSLSSLLGLLWILCLGATTAFAQAEHCDESLRPDVGNRNSYRERGDRCEGLYIDKKSGNLRLASLHFAPLRFETGPEKHVDLSWSPIAGEVRLRAISLRSRTYYRMDSLRPAGSGSYRWPTGILARVGLSESAGINRRGVGDERAPQRKSSELR